MKDATVLMNTTHTNTGDVFVYWDNSNIFISAREEAREREGADGYDRVRIKFKNLYALAIDGRMIKRAMAVGSVPPSLERLWNRLSQQGIDVELSERGGESGTEQNVDEQLQNAMLRDALIHNGNPGIAVLLTGDGSGYYRNKGFYKTIELMHKKGWQIELLSWRSSCHKNMLDWAQSNGVFVALDDFYDSITFLDSRGALAPRDEVPLDLSRRPKIRQTIL